MPLFLDKKLFFIHIPKTGGSSIERILTDAGFSMSLFTDKGSVFINGHSPQHLTFMEIQELGLVNPSFTFFTVIRDPLQRVVSEYNYLLEKRLDISAAFYDFDSFLELFLNYDNSLLFDNHNLSSFDYISDKYGQIDQCIQIFSYFDTEGIERLTGLNGLGNYHELKTANRISGLKQRHIDRIKSFYYLDFRLLNKFF